MVRGVIQDWGLVEFFEPEDTEATQMKLNGRRIRDQQIRIQYCIPGVRAINIHNEVTTSFPSCDMTDPWPTVC